MRQDAKKILRIISLSILFVFIIVYAFFRSKDLIFGVKIKNVNLTDGAVVTESILEVKGNARNAIKLSLNGKEISVNQQGDFDETISLLSGYNIVNLRAEDKFGKVDEKNYKLIYEL
jgi:hypothetical protein